MERLGFARYRERRDGWSDQSGEAVGALIRDLTAMDSFGKQLLTNDEVLAVDLSGNPATQVLDGDLEVWVSNLRNGSYYVGIFNKVSGFGRPPPAPSTSYEAALATLSGSAAIASCPACAGGEKVGGLGLGVQNTVTFSNVYVLRTGEYLIQVDSMTIGLRSYLYRVNGGAYQTLNCSGGSFLLPASTTVPVHLEKELDLNGSTFNDPATVVRRVQLHAGVNTIQFGNSTGYAPDLDRIVIAP